MDVARFSKVLATGKEERRAGMTTLQVYPLGDNANLAA